MAAFTTYAETKSLTETGGRSVVFSVLKSNGSNANLQLNSTWSRMQFNNDTTNIPSTAAALSSTTAGALAQHPKLPGTLTADLWLTELEFSYGHVIPGTRYTAFLFDRLSHQGGLSGTSTSEQTTNLPTAALTRHTSGEGVMAFLEVYVNLGSTSTTATISYTNQAGTAGQISKELAITNNLTNLVDGFTPFCLADGDTGVRSVESITLAASTLTAGNFGITLAKRIAMFPLDTGCMVERQPLREMIFGGAVVKIDPAACLMLAIISGSTASTGVMCAQGRIGLAEK